MPPDGTGSSGTSDKRTLKWRLTAEQFVEHDAQTVLIAGGSHLRRVSGRLLRRHVGGRARLNRRAMFLDPTPQRRAANQCRSDVQLAADDPGAEDGHDVRMDELSRGSRRRREASALLRKGAIFSATSRPTSPSYAR